MILTTRYLRWMVLLAVLAVCIGWSHHAISQLLATSITEHDRVAQYGPTSQPVQVVMNQARHAQLYWGRQSLFAVACSFFLLLVVLVNWVLDGQKIQSKRE